jgi:hypothetical protein
MAVAWEDSQRPNKGIGKKIHRLPPGKSGQAWLLGPPIAVWLHWVGGAQPHHRENCPYCPLAKFRRWYAPALAPARDGAPWLACVLELNADCVDVLIDHNCAGLMVDLRRGPGNRSPLQLLVSAKQPTEFKRPMPPAFDVRPVLEAIWNLAEGEAAAGNEEPPDTLPFCKDQAG